MPNLTNYRYRLAAYESRHRLNGRHPHYNNTTATALLPVLVPHRHTADTARTLAAIFADAERRNAGKVL